MEEEERRRRKRRRKRNTKWHSKTLTTRCDFRFEFTLLSFLNKMFSVFSFFLRMGVNTGWEGKGRGGGRGGEKVELFLFLLIGNSEKRCYFTGSSLDFTVFYFTQNHGT
jgi:hypothetical protein